MRTKKRTKKGKITVKMNSKRTENTKKERVYAYSCKHRVSTLISVASLYTVILRFFLYLGFIFGLAGSSVSTLSYFKLSENSILVCFSKYVF